MVKAPEITGGISAKPWAPCWLHQAQRGALLLVLERSLAGVELRLSYRSAFRSHAIDLILDKFQLIFRIPSNGGIFPGTR